jgi:hypothetical protein
MFLKMHALVAVLITVAYGAHGEKPAGSICYVGECFDQYVTHASKRPTGLIEVSVKTRNYNVSEPRATPGPQTYSTYWISCRPSGGYVENEEHMRLREPNPKPSHATEPGDKLWQAVCR